MKRAAEKSNTSSNGLSAGKSRYSLIDYRLKDRCGKISRACPLIDKGLNVGLCKHSATGGNRIDLLVVFGSFVKSLGIGLQKCRHLIDKAAGASRANAVHAFFKTARKIDDLGILTAKLDGNIGLRCYLFKCCRYRHDLLNKGDIK